MCRETKCHLPLPCHWQSAGEYLQTALLTVAFAAAGLHSWCRRIYSHEDPVGFEIKSLTPVSKSSLWSKYNQSHQALLIWKMPPGVFAGGIVTTARKLPIPRKVETRTTHIVPAKPSSHLKEDSFVLILHTLKINIFRRFTKLHIQLLAACDKRRRDPRLESEHLSHSTWIYTLGEGPEQTTGTG